MHVQAQIFHFLREESPTSRLMNCVLFIILCLHVDAFSWGLFKLCGFLKKHLKERMDEIILKRQKDGHCCGMVLCREVRLAVVDRADCCCCWFLFSPAAGKELFGLDTLQKSLWIKLLEEMFLGMPSEFPWGDEIMLFLNVFNGALILHPEDSALLRQYAATVINTAVHFNHLFSLSGYQWVLPSMLQVSLPGSSQGVLLCPADRQQCWILALFLAQRLGSSEVF